MKPLTLTLNPKLDLTLERIVDVPRALVWKAWTEPEHLMKWFCPKPWQVTECQIDLRPGGKFRTVMQGPDGVPLNNEGCYLEVFENERLTWTSALLENYRPSTSTGDCVDFGFTAFITLEDAAGDGTKYTVQAIHPHEEARNQHNDRGFDQGWGTALMQMVEEIKSGGIK
jgi:uncharacterized protein YndB with AHSA1/START domain